MKKILAVILLAASIAFVAPSAQAAPTVAKTASVCHEEQPCWNCSTMGNFICGPKAARQAEAWKLFDTAGFTADELSKPMTVTYRGTTSYPNRLANGHEWYTIPVKGSKLHHVFEIVFGR